MEKFYPPAPKGGIRYFSRVNEKIGSVFKKRNISTGLKTNNTLVKHFKNNKSITDFDFFLPGVYKSNCWSCAKTCIK